MSSGKKSLVIVESPAKAKTINRFLGPSFTVEASMGHVRDLPESSLGVEIDDEFRPHYVIIKGKKKVVSGLRAAATKAKDVYLAPDMDREGEAIAWHLASIIAEQGTKIHRVIFNEITEGAIRQAFANPTEIDMNKVNAQQARRVLDRLVGYMVSPLLWKVVHRRTSAGRVQSVALRLICEREEAIRKFVSREYWTIDADFRSVRGDQFTATLETIDKAKASIGSADEAERIRDDVGRHAYAVAGVDKREKKRSPKPPYITSTLQQDAARRLGFSAAKTMLIAQTLYEGVDLGDKERVGLITYMRTDSVRVSEEACACARDYISSELGAAYLPAAAKRFRRGKASQDAHEAIRPTDVLRLPQAVSPFLTKDQVKIYRLVWERFMASQMADARFESTTVEVEGGPYFFKATGSVMKFDGFLRVSGEKPEDTDVSLPALVAGESLAIARVEPTRHETEPPPRYTEASLIKELEDKGIGRPSTYATIMSTIIHRRYAEKQKAALKPTELGETVLKILLRIFPDIFDVGFTARMEEELDRIESGQDEWVKVVRDFYDPFRKDLDSADAIRKELKAAIQEVVDEKCETCGRPMVKKWGRHGQFLACSGFPECKNTRPMQEQVSTDAKCPECGGPMIVRIGRFGKFLACKRYPECKGTARFSLGIKCPECGGEVVEKRTKRRRTFYGCRNYPKCKFATWDKPVGQPCPTCNYPVMVVKASGDDAGRTRCPKCDAEAGT